MRGKAICVHGRHHRIMVAVRKPYHSSKVDFIVYWGTVSGIFPLAQ